MIKKSITYIFLLILAGLTMFNSYAYFDELIKQEEPFLRIGEWQIEDQNEYSLFFNFENYSTEWQFNNAEISSHQHDNKNGYSSVRIKGRGNITTNFKVKNIYNISFFAAVTQNHFGGTVSLEVSKNRIQWFTIREINDLVNTNLKYYSIDINDSILGSFQLKTSDTLYIRFISYDNRFINIDDVSINYIGSSSIVY